MRRSTVLVPALLLAATAWAEAQTPSAPPKTVRKIAIGGEGGWDYLTADAEARRLYISRGDRVVVLDTETEKPVGEVTGTPGVHGVAIVPALGRGFTSNGGDDTVTVFDLKSLKATGQIKVGGRPDAIMYDPSSDRVLTFNHGSKDATAIDPSAMTVAGTVALAGVPEAAVSDGRGHVFVNLMDTSEVAEFDPRSTKVVNRWSLAPGERPTGLAIDREHRRLYSVCGGNQTMVVLDAGSGTILAKLPIGRGSDGCVFDPDRGLAYSSNGGDGTLSVVREESPGKFAVAATIPTQASARTMTFDPRTHRIYLSAATYVPTPAPTATPETKPAELKTAEAKTAPAGKGGRRRAMVPNSFVILVVGD